MTHACPDWAAVKEELKRPHVTKRVVWEEYTEASEFVYDLNNTIITGQHPFIQDEHIASAFHTFYEQTHDSHRLIIHLKDGITLTGYLIDTDTISPAKFCRAMNRQTRLDDRERNRLIMNCIISPPDLKTPVSIH